MRHLKTVWPVLAGFFTVVLLSIGGDFLLEYAGIFPGAAHPELYASWMLAVALLYRTIFTVLGGYVTAYLAPEKKMQHVYALGALGTVGGIAGVVAGWDLSEHWYPIALAVLAFPSVYFGGWLFHKVPLKESAILGSLRTVVPDAPKQEITITRMIDANRQRVWDAWTKQEFLSDWFGAPPFTATKETTSIDLRVGGQWRADLVNAADGSRMPFGGKYLEINSPSKLVFTIEESGRTEVETVTISLTDRAGTTEMTFTQKGHLPVEQYGEPLRSGYNAFFERMKWTIQKMQ